MAAIRILVNGSPTVIEKGATIASVLSQVNAYHVKGSIVAIGHGQRRNPVEMPRYRLSTNKGDVIFETSVENIGRHSFEGLMGSKSKLINVSAKSVSIGPFVSCMSGRYQEYELLDGDIAMDNAGRGSGNSCLVISKGRHRAYYSLVPPVPVGRVLSGKKTVLALTPDDTVLGICRLPPSVQACMMAVRKATDLEVKITKEGTSVFTFAEATVNYSVPRCSELFLRASEGGIIRCELDTSTCLMADGLKGIRITGRNAVERKRGSISIRNDGKNSGKFYFYKRNRQGSVAHTVIGKITKGIELLDVAKAGDCASLLTNPRLIDCVGLTQNEAQDCLSSIQAGQTRRGDLADDAIVVEQRPAPTLWAKGLGSIETVGLPKERIVQIRLHEGSAPSSVRFFRAVTGLTYGMIGTLRIGLRYASMTGSVFLEGDVENAEVPNLDPENVPHGRVKPGDLGITNSIVSRVGTIGVRIDESEEYGPTCENLESTNIIGKVLGSSLNELRRGDKGQTVYISETVQDDPPPIMDPRRPYPL